VDGRGNAYVNGGGFDLTAGEAFGGDVLQTIELDRGCFACALGGPDRMTLFMMATRWNGPERMFAEPRTGQVLTARASAPGVGWP